MNQNRKVTTDDTDTDKMSESKMIVVKNGGYAFKTLEF
jgi:hypothetical protein